MGAMRVRPLLGLVLCLSLAISQGQLISSNPNSTAGVSAPPSQEQLAATKANAERNLAEAQAHIDASNARQKQLYEAQVAYQKKEGLPISPASYVSGLPTLPVSVGPPLMPAPTASVSPAPLPPRKFTSPAKKSFAPPPAKKGAQKGQKAGSGAKGSGGKGGKSGKRKRFAQVMGIHPSESPAAAETAESSSSVLHAEAEADQSESSSFRFSNAAQSPMDAMNKLANMQPPKVVALPAEAMNPADIEASLAATLKAAADGQKNTKPISDAEAKQATQALLSAAAASKATADATKAKADKQAEALDNERAKEKAAAAAANFAAASRLQAAAEARLITQLHAKLEAEANDKTHESPATLELYYLNKKAANPHSGKETETIPSLPDGFEEDTLYNETVNIGITKLPAFEPVPEDRTRKQNETRYLPTEDLAPSTYEGVHRLKVERELVAIKRSHDFDGFKLPKKAPKWVAKYNLQRTVPGVPTPLNGKSLATNTTAATNGTASAPISSSAVSPQVTIVAPAAAATATNQTAAAPTPSAPKPHVGGHDRNGTNSTQHLHPIAVDNVHVKVSPL